MTLSTLPRDKRTLAIAFMQGHRYDRVNEPLTVKQTLPAFIVLLIFAGLFWFAWVVS